MRRKNDPRAIASYLSMLEATNGKKHIIHRHMKHDIFTMLPGESEAEARERLGLLRGDQRTDTERAEDRQAEILRDLRQTSNNPNL